MKTIKTLKQLCIRAFAKNRYHFNYQKSNIPLELKEEIKNYIEKRLDKPFPLLTISEKALLEKTVLDIKLARYILKTPVLLDRLGTYLFEVLKTHKELFNELGSKPFIRNRLTLLQVNTLIGLHADHEGIQPAMKI